MKGFFKWIEMLVIMTITFIMSVIFNKIFGFNNIEGYYIVIVFVSSFIAWSIYEFQEEVVHDNPLHIFSFVWIGFIMMEVIELVNIKGFSYVLFSKIHNSGIFLAIAGVVLYLLFIVLKFMMYGMMIYPVHLMFLKFREKEINYVGGKKK